MKRFVALALLLLCFRLTAQSAPEPVFLPDVPLVDEHAQPFWIRDLKGKYVFLSFLYTHCPLAEACPLTITLAKHLGKRWASKVPNVPFQILMVTMDPSRDTPNELLQFGNKRKVDYRYFKLATGTETHIEMLKKGLHVMGRKAEDGNIYHDSMSFLIDPNGKVIKVLPENKWSARDVLCALPGPIPGCGGLLQANGDIGF